MIRPLPKPLFPPTNLKRLPKRGDMTVCIAALSNEFKYENEDKKHDPEVLRHIVCCFDMRIETSGSGAEIGFK
ncbi:MAG: hypothetical protein JWN92_1042, partial [Candidatus Acidoferrum typicum]|nr:hypothetical protein [Candidatus Acidoferrum typicum]